MDAEPPSLPRLLGPQDAAAVAALCDAALVPGSGGFLQRREPGFWPPLLAGEGGVALGIGAADGGLLALAVLRLPDAAWPNPLPRFPRVPDHAWPHATGMMEHALVHPVARGRGMHRTLLAARLQHARGAGMAFAVAGVKLANLVSWRNLLAAGFAIVGQRDVAGGPVLGLLRPVEAPWPAPVHAVPRRLVPERDSGLHGQALADGLVGVALGPACVRYVPG